MSSNEDIQREPRTVTIISPGYFQNGGYRDDDRNALVVCWEAGNKVDVWAVHDDLGPLPFLNPAPSGQQKERIIRITGRIRCPRSDSVVFKEN